MVYANQVRFWNGLDHSKTEPKWRPFQKTQTYTTFERSDFEPLLYLWTQKQWLRTTMLRHSNSGTNELSYNC